MLVLKDHLINRPVLSLRTGGTVATTSGLILNPNNLKIEGIYCHDRLGREVKILLPQDIREFISKGFVINDDEVLSEPDELVRLQEVIELNYEIIHKAVFSDTKKRIGKVVDYAVDHDSLYIKKLYVTQSSLRKLGEALSVDRTQIVEVTDKKVIILDPQQPVEEAMPSVIPATP